jgi:hypothetical protein
LILMAAVRPLIRKKLPAREAAMARH